MSGDKSVFLKAVEKISRLNANSSGKSIWVRSMKIALNDMRRYAIDRRTEITIIDSQSGRRCSINARGQVSIPDEDRSFKIEEVIDAADGFELTLAGKPQTLSRDQIAATISDHLKSRGFSAVSKEED